ncbi:hypothetical protein Leryth_023390 [Lithospermum erythrorhizon]|nr:hypothetical protein Leryth_023390 [Lithospermum erythrorhizon]
MYVQLSIFARIRRVICTPLCFNSLPISLCNANSLIYTQSSLFCTTLASTENNNQELGILDVGNETKDSSDVLRKWGCSESDVCKIFSRRPSIQAMDIGILQSKLKILSDIGISSSELVKIIHCRPRFLNCRINDFLDERLEFLQELFGSRERLLKAIVRNPSLLTYDLMGKMRPVVEMYERIGVSRKELSSMLMTRPTMFPRSTLDEKKMELIRRTGVTPDSKMYKYVTTLFAISRTETIHKKIAYLEKFGLSEDEVLHLFGRSPLTLTLSTDKFQRNMTFILSRMNLPVSMVLANPCLLFYNLENVLKPRFLLALKIEDMGLEPTIKGSAMLRALRMKEDRFIRAFITCHPESVSIELLEFYKHAKDVKRLAESSKKSFRKGFPF